MSIPKEEVTALAAKLLEAGGLTTGQARADALKLLALQEISRGISRLDQRLQTIEERLHDIIRDRD